MKKAITLIIFIVAFQAFASVNTTIHGITTKNWTAMDSLCFEVEGRYGGNWFTRQMTYRAIKNLFYDPDSALTTTRSSSIGLRVKVQGIHRWHHNSDIADGTTIALNAANALYIPGGGVTSTQIYDGTIATGDMSNGSITWIKTHKFLKAAKPARVISLTAEQHINMNFTADLITVPCTMRVLTGDGSYGTLIAQEIAMPSAARDILFRSSDGTLGLTPYDATDDSLETDRWVWLGSVYNDAKMVEFNGEYEVDGDSWKDNPAKWTTLATRYDSNYRWKSDYKPVRNLVRDPYLKFGTTYYNDNSAYATLTLDSAVASVYGRYNLKMVTTNTTGYFGPYISLYDREVKPHLTVGDSIHFAAQLRKNGTGSARIDIYFINAAGGTISSISGGTSVSANNTWTSCLTAGIIPANTVKIWPIARIVSGAVSDNLWTCGWNVYNKYDTQKYPIDGGERIYYNDISDSLNAPYLLLPDTLYASALQECAIYFDQITLSLNYKNFMYSVTCDSGKVYENSWRWTPATDYTGTKSWSVSIYDRKYHLLASGTTQIKVHARTVHSLDTLLVIGDSWTADVGLVGEQIKLSSNITTIGTLSSADTLHEGRGGWTYALYESDASSPFVFSTHFNFTQYLSTNDFDWPKWVVIELGTNDITPYDKTTITAANISTLMAKMDTLVNEIKEAVPGVNIGLCYIGGVAYSQDAWGDDYDATRLRMWRRQNQYLWNQALKARYGTGGSKFAANVTLIPINCFLDTEHNFESTSTAYNARNPATYTMQSNALHPSAYGYLQVADAIFGWIVNHQ